MTNRFILTLLIAALAIAGCKKDQSATGADAKQATGLYAKGFNALLADPKRMIDGYFSSLPADHAPELTRKPSLMSASFVGSKLKEAREAFAAADTAAPESLAALKPFAEAAVGAADKAVTTYEDAYKYYEAESYKDDKGARAKQLHDQMIAASRDFNAAMAKLGDGMESIEDAQTADELAKYADDKSYSYWFRFYNQQAKRLIVAVTRAGSPAELAKLPAAAKALEPIDAGLAAFVSGKGASLSSSFKSYVDNATTFQAETKKLMRLLEAGKTFDEPAVGQAADAMIGAYNNLVRMSNALLEVEAVNGLKDE